MIALTLLASMIIIGPVAGSKPGIQTISDSQLKASGTTIGGAKVLATDRTVQH